MQLPQQVAYILQALEQHGHEAYVVGGCVRDLAMGVVPHDWDVCTSAKPDEIAACFEHMRVIQTGLRHGTVTVAVDALRVEVTTFRVDGPYHDGRHPAHVTFVGTLEADLARRDFTVNAMAYHPRGAITDPFGGMKDIRAKCIRCVGEASLRFEEDGLRILRALRFASTLGFAVEDATADALRRSKLMLKNISGERIRVELGKLLCGDAAPVMRSFADVIGVAVPEILPCVGFDQHSQYHCYDVYEHTLCTLENIPPLETLRLAALMHDLGKPHCFTMDSAGIGHFYGHAKISVQLADAMMRRLKYDRATQTRVLALIGSHDAVIEGDSQVKRWMRKLGAEAFGQLLELMRADALAHHRACAQVRMDNILRLKMLYEEALSANACYEVSTLAINGNDLIAGGMSEGPQIGDALERLSGLVIDGALENSREALLGKVKSWRYIMPNEDDA